MAVLFSVFIYLLLFFWLSFGILLAQFFWLGIGWWWWWWWW